VSDEREDPTWPAESGDTDEDAESGYAVRGFDPDDLGSTADGFGLTSGGTGTAIDESVLIGDDSAPSNLGMGMDETTDMVPGAIAPPLDSEREGI